MSDFLPAPSGGLAASWRGALATVRGIVGTEGAPVAAVNENARQQIPLLGGEAALLALVAGNGPSLVLFDAAWRRDGSGLRDCLATVVGQRPALSLGWVDVNAAPALAGRFGVTAVPTLMLFRGGQAVASRLGAGNETEIEPWLARNLDADPAE